MHMVLIAIDLIAWTDIAALAEPPRDAAPH
jgi:hypothetical protein